MRKKRRVKSEFQTKIVASKMDNTIKQSNFSKKNETVRQRPKKLRFFWELKREAQDAAVAEELADEERFDWDARGDFNGRF